MPFTSWAGPVSTFGGMLSAAVATATYVTATVQRRRLTTRDRASQIRESIRAIVSSLQYINRELTDGSILISAAAAVTDNLRSRLPEQADAAKLREILAQDGLMLSVAITGWFRNPAAEAFLERVQKLRNLTDSFDGALNVYQEITELLLSLIRDGHSPLIFNNILEVLDKKEFHFVDWNQPLHKLFNQINVSLQANAASYFVARYAKAVKEMQSFIEYLSKVLLNLDDNQLLALGNLQTVNTGATHTNTMRASIRNMSRYLKPEEETALLLYVDNLETYISKEHAGNELKRHKE